MILLKELALTNFLSHKETVVRFSETQKLLIDGDSGAGKSSISEAIVWVLYGQGRTPNASLIRRGADKGEVKLVLTTPQGEVEVIRSINKNKHSLQVIINGVANPLTGVRELQAWIEQELTGASYLLFVNSIAYMQGGTDSFVTQNATKRKDLLLEIVKTIDFESYYEKTKKRISQEENALTGLEHEVLVRQAWLKTAEESIKIKSDIEASIAKCSIEEDVTTKSRETSVVAVSKVEEQLKVINRVKTEINTIKAGEQQNVTLIETIEKESAALRVGIIEHRPTLGVETEIQNATQKIADVNKQISDAATVNARRVELLSSQPMDMGWGHKAEEAQKVMSDPNNHNKCSNATCPYFAERGEKLVQYAGLYAEYTQKHGAYLEALRLWKETYESLPVIDIGPLKLQLASEMAILSALQNELTKIKAAEDNTKKIEVNRAKCVELLTTNITLTEKRSVLEAELEELKKGVDEESMAKHHQNIVSCDAALNILRQERARHQQQLGSILDTEKKIPETQQVLEQANHTIESMRTNIKRLTLLKDAFGSSGVKAVVIDYILPELEEKINAILSQMSEFRVVLDTQIEKADGEGNKEGLFITIINDIGEEMPLEAYSGGEKLKIIVSIAEALATLQKCGFRIYDEVFLGLDENSLESFTKVLDNLLTRFPQVICISHLQEIKAAFEHRIHVSKHNGVSTVN